MKKIISITQFILVLFISNQLQAQFPRLEVKVNSIQETLPGKADAEIHITVDGEKPPYVYQIFDKAPWDGGKELAKSQKIFENQYVFISLPNGSYFVCVTDSEGNSDCEIIIINNH